MPRTIDEGFDNFLSYLTPSPVESDNAKSHRVSIEHCLASNFDIERFFRTGSFGNGTSISGFSDVDYFAKIPEEYLTANSNTLLSKVRDALNTRFPNTNVHVNCPAVVVPFGSDPSETTEVVPAKYMKKGTNNYDIFKIADCSGGWQYSSPEVHNAYVRYINSKLNGKVKPLVRFIKAWKYFQHVPISSFYLELITTKYATKQKVIVYDIDIRQVFSFLKEIEFTPFNDPMGISGYITACSSETQLNEACSKVETALTRSRKAVIARKKEKVKDAFEWWNLIYNGNFPTYYRR
jgi:hypothetical protein